MTKLNSENPNSPTRTIKFLLAAFLGAGLVLASSSPSLAHHSHAMFDHTKEVTVTGTVSHFSFRNPHVFLYLDVEGDNGDVVQWAIEMSNINNTLRQGIGGGTFEPGDVLTVSVNPLINGKPGGNYTRIVTPEGKSYPES